MSTSRGFGVIGLIIILALIGGGWWYVRQNPEILDKIPFFSTDPREVLEQANSVRDLVESNHQDIDAMLEE